MVAEAQALDDLAVAHVEAGNYAAGKNGAISSERNPVLDQRAAADRAGDAGRGQRVQVRGVAHAARRLPGDGGEAAHAFAVERDVGPGERAVAADVRAQHVAHAALPRGTPRAPRACAARHAASRASRAGACRPAPGARRAPPRAARRQTGRASPRPWRGIRWRCCRRPRDPRRRRARAPRRRGAGCRRRPVCAGRPVRRASAAPRGCRRRRRVRRRGRRRARGARLRRRSGGTARAASCGRASHARTRPGTGARRGRRAGRWTGTSSTTTAPGSWRGSARRARPTAPGGTGHRGSCRGSRPR